jgi:2'-5' RNA ligase
MHGGEDHLDEEPSRPRESSPGEDKSVRAFVAIELSVEVRAFCEAAIARARRVLGPDGRAVRWVDPAGIHLTLKFLGAAPATQIAELTERLRSELAGQPPFAVGVGKLGVFPSQRAPRVLWLAVLGDLAQLRACQERVEAATEPLGYPGEKRPFQAHLTLGRVRETATPEQRLSIGRLLPSWPEEAGPRFEATAVSLMQSHLAPTGATYTRLAEIPFSSGSDTGGS